jgi:serine phosphatase RsbU (regulator of sigma subunit)/anti-sigma regulatory factor (Ser/Thr protein kinase)
VTHSPEQQTVLEGLQQVWQIHYPGQISLQTTPPDDGQLAVRLRDTDGRQFWVCVPAPADHADRARMFLNKLAPTLQKGTSAQVQVQRLTNETITAWNRLSFMHTSVLLMRSMDDSHEICMKMLEFARQTLTIEGAFIAYAEAHDTATFHTLHQSLPQVYESRIIAMLDDPDTPTIISTPQDCRVAGVPDLVCFIGQQLPTDAGPPAYIGLYNHQAEHIIDSGDIQIFESLAEQITTVQETYALFRQRIEMRQLQRDLNIASEVQTSFLPARLPDIPGYGIATELLPANKIGGDFYDMFQDAGNTLLMLCDVAGKGISAALVAAEIRTAVHLLYTPDDDPGDVLTLVNRRLYGDLLNAERFATAILLSHRTDDNTWQYASAGHTTGLLVRAGTLDVQYLEGTGLPVGVLPDDRVATASFDFQPGDVLVLYSDGLSEAEDDDGQILDVNGIVPVLQVCQSASAETIRQVMLQAYAHHRGNQTAHDDLTLVVVKHDDTPPADVPAFYWRIPSDLTELATLQRATNPLLTHLPDADTAQTWLYELQLVLTEVISNIIRHGYDDEEGMIHGLVQLHSDDVQVDIVDGGKAYTLPEQPPAMQIMDDLPEGGYGLHIIYNLTDRFEHRRLANETNHWHLRRQLPVPATTG